MGTEFKKYFLYIKIKKILTFRLINGRERREERGERRNSNFDREVTR